MDRRHRRFVFRHGFGKGAIAGTACGVAAGGLAAALDASGVNMLRFDFRDFTRKNCAMTVYIDQADSTGAERMYNMHAGDTQQLSKMPEEMQSRFRTKYHLPETAGNYVRGVR